MAANDAVQRSIARHERKIARKKVPTAPAKGSSDCWAYGMGQIEQKDLDAMRALRSDVWPDGTPTPEGQRYLLPGG